MLEKAHELEVAHLLHPHMEVLFATAMILSTKIVEIAPPVLVSTTCSIVIMDQIVRLWVKQRQELGKMRIVNQLGGYNIEFGKI